MPRLSRIFLVAIALGATSSIASATVAPDSGAAVSTAPPITTNVERARPATRIPEPDTVALFLLGAAGLVIGRRLSRSGRRAAPDA